MTWEERGDEVWLLVGPHDDIAMEDVIRHADDAGYAHLDLHAVSRVLATFEPEAVAQLGKPSVPGVLTVTVDAGDRTATLQVIPPGPRQPPLGRHDVAAALADAGVKVGIDHFLVGSVPLHVPGEYLVATGWDPSRGGDGRVEYTVELSREFRPQARRDGGVDFHAVASIPDVVSGQLLAVLVDPTPGRSGRTVRGDAIPAEAGEPAELPTGENVTVSGDGRRLYAAIDGLLEISGGVVSVRPEFVVPGDVDLSTGSVSFRGDIVVRGSVRPGFRVTAGGRLVVMGDVEEAEAEGGALVWVRGAVVGEQAVVRSGGDVKVRTVHHGRIEARRNLYIERESHEATILAGAELVLEAARNRLSGGSAWVGHQVMAGEIGAVGGVATRVNAGVDPFSAELLDALTAKQAEHEHMLERVEVAIAPFAEGEVAAALPAERREAVERLVSIAATLRAQLVEVRTRIADLQPAEDDSRPRVVARTALRPGTIIGIKGSTYTVRTTQHRVAATAIDGRVTLVPVGNERVHAAPCNDRVTGPR